ncbi:MAG: hypothetical protein GXO32_02315 [Crenarchaeota archaeon]|nr:hypothetical protein [Thermoproteota archaeon]
MVIDIAKKFIDYIYDELVKAPAIESYVNQALIPRDLAYRYANMYQDDVIADLSRRGIKPLDSSALEELVYALYDGGVAYIGKGTAGALYVDSLMPSTMARNVVAMLHTHPVPIPIPTPEDLASAANIGYRTECVASRDSKHVDIVCVTPRRKWSEAVEACSKLGRSVLSVERFLVIGNSEGIAFVPMPSPREKDLLIEDMITAMSPVAKVEVVRV